MSAKIERLESEISKLPEYIRAQLLGRMLKNLATPPAPDDVLHAWAKEAERRDRATSSGQEAGRPANEVLERLG